MSNYYDYEDDIDFMDDWDFLDEYAEAEKEEKKRRRFKTVKYISAGLLFVVAVALAVMLVIKTGILEDKNIFVNYLDKSGNARQCAHENVEGFFCGAGDVFASAFVGCLARGKSEEQAILLASDFVTAAIRRSAKEVPDKRYGLNFEGEIFGIGQSQ